MSDLFRYPMVPGARRTDTSRDAAADIAPRTQLLRDRALQVLEHSNGLTADEVAGRMGASILSIRPRITELVELRMIRDTGERRKNAISGRKAIVWAAIQPARLKAAG